MRARPPLASRPVATFGPEEGSALFLVVGATAALAALALATLSASLVAYEIAVFEHEGTLARLLSRSALDLLGGAIADGSAVLPVAGSAVWAPPLPTTPPSARPLPAGCGFRVELSPVVTATAWPRLVDAVAVAECGRGLHTRSARFAVAEDGTVKRLF